MNIGRNVVTKLIIASLLLLIAIPTQVGINQLTPLVTITVHPAEGQIQGTKSFIIVISKHGFNGSDSSNLLIAVNEGDRVEITFVMDEEERTDNRPENRHLMEIPGYDIRAEEITPSHPENTVIFLADRVGNFTIMCGSETWDCPGHELLQDGKLVVKSGAVSSEVEATPPKQVEASAENKTAEETISAQPPQEEGPVETRQPARPQTFLKTNLKLNVITQCFPQCPINLVAILGDNEGKPVAGLPVAFNVNTTFGILQIGSVYTNSKGTASVNYTATHGSALEFTASFRGGGGYEASTSQVVIQLTPISEDMSIQLLTARNIAGGATVLVGVLIWSTYLLILRQLRGIVRESRSLGREGGR